MSDSIALSPEQFIFANGEDLRTTSLKVAERFGKEHKNVLALIDKVLTQVSDSFGKLNFEPTEYEQENNLGLMVKYRAFNLTKDGFMFLVMGFTGKDAAAIKEWYINAFNAMHNKLFPKSNYGLKSLTLKKTQKAVEGGLSLESQDEIKTLINEMAAALPKAQQVQAIKGMWGALNAHFGTKTLKGTSKLAGYKFIPEANRLECLSIIARLPFNDLITLSRTEMSDLIDRCVEKQIAALPAPTLEGDVMPKETKNTLTVDLSMPEGLRQLTFDFKTNAYQNGRWAMWQADGNFTIRIMDDDEFLTSSKTLHKFISDHMGGLIKRDDLPGIIEASAVRLKH